MATHQTSLLVRILDVSVWAAPWASRRRTTSSWRTSSFWAGPGRGPGPGPEVGALGPQADVILLPRARHHRRPPHQRGHQGDAGRRVPRQDPPGPRRRARPVRHARGGHALAGRPQRRRLLAVPRAHAGRRRAAILDFFWAKHKMQPMLMTLLINVWRLLARTGPMSITTTPEEYRDRFLKMCRVYVETEEDRQD